MSSSLAGSEIDHGGDVGAQRQPELAAWGLEPSAGAVAVSLARPPLGDLADQGGLELAVAGCQAVGKRLAERAPAAARSPHLAQHAAKLLGDRALVTPVLRSDLARCESQVLSDDLVDGRERLVPPARLERRREEVRRSIHDSTRNLEATRT